MPSGVKETIPLAQGNWLSKDELLFHRMVTFHRQRLEAIASGPSNLAEHEKGYLLIHLIPQHVVVDRIRLDTTQLKQQGSLINPLGERSGRTRFNVDGLLNYDGRDSVRAYSQVYRDGRVEALMPDVAYPLAPNQENSVFALRDSICEKGAIDLVGSHLRFCKAVEIAPPIWMFSALLDCQGVRILAHRAWRDVSEHAVDRSPAYLPELEITTLESNLDSLLRPWCDSLWQAAGLERSYNYDEQGVWCERR